MKNVLVTENLNKEYGFGNGLVHAVKDVNIKIKFGDFVCILGKSGSGKTTLLHMLGALENPTSGKIIIDDIDISNLDENKLAVFRRKKIGIIFQHYNLISTLTVWENIILPLGFDNNKIDREFILDILTTLDLIDKIHKLPNTLSGGQQQRVAIARALAAKPTVVLADEPTGNLDSKTETEVLTLLKASAKRYGQTIIMITHDEDIAQLADKVLLMEDGKVIKQ